MKVRSLLAKFGFAKRSDANTTVITQSLSNANVSVNPAIIRLGAEWQLDIDDWVFLTVSSAIAAPIEPASALSVPLNWNADGWFDRVDSIPLRSEKEVEIKFILPLLAKLGYGDDDRFDGMSFAGSVGSRKTTYTADFALHNAQESALKGQVLLIAEAKKEKRLVRPTELENAFRQAKCYAMWAQCRHLLVTDGRMIVAYQILRGGHDDQIPLFSCERHELRERFAALYAALSRDVLTKFYLRLVSSIDEAH